MYKILVAGCGYLGMPVAEYFTSKKQKVWATTRSPGKAARLQAQGITPVVWDFVKNTNAPEQVPYFDFVVICVAPDQRTKEAYQATYLDGVSNVLEALKRGVRPKLLIYISSTGVYGKSKDDWVDEQTKPEPDSERSKILLESEMQVINSGIPSVIFRLGGIYGPDRNALGKLGGSEHQSGKDSYVNLIHRHDAVLAIPVLLKNAASGETYIGVDDYPVPRSELMNWLREQTGMVTSPPSQTGAGICGKRCRNDKLKSLGFAFKFPTFREGYKDLLDGTHAKKK